MNPSRDLPIAKRWLFGNWRLSPLLDYSSEAAKYHRRHDDEVVKQRSSAKATRSNAENIVKLAGFNLAYMFRNGNHRDFRPSPQKFRMWNFRDVELVIKSIPNEVKSVQNLIKLPDSSYPLFRLSAVTGSTLHWWENWSFFNLYFLIVFS